MYTEYRPQPTQHQLLRPNPFTVEDNPFVMDNNFWISSMEDPPHPTQQVPVPVFAAKKVGEEEGSDSIDHSSTKEPQKHHSRRSRTREKVPRPKKPSRTLSSEEEEEAKGKRKREDKSLVEELRSLLEEGSKSKRRVEKEEVEMNELKLRNSQTDYAVYLTETVAQQQVMIAKLNQEIYHMGAKYRMEQDELRRRLQEVCGRPPVSPPLQVDATQDWLSNRNSLMLELGLKPSPPQPPKRLPPPLQQPSIPTVQQTIVQTPIIPVPVTQQRIVESPPTPPPKMPIAPKAPTPILQQRIAETPLLLNKTPTQQKIVETPPPHPKTPIPIVAQKIVETPLPLVQQRTVEALLPIASPKLPLPTAKTTSPKSTVEREEHPLKKYLREEKSREVTLPKERKRTSWVWEYFEMDSSKKSANGEKYAKCQVKRCEDPVVTIRSGSTCSMSTHLWKEHEIYRPMKEDEPTQEVTTPEEMDVEATGLPTSVSEMVKQRPRIRKMPKTLVSLEENLMRQKTIVETAPRSLMEELEASVPTVAPKIRLSLKAPVKVKIEPVEAFAEEDEEEAEKDESLYSWKIVEEKNPRSLNIYGFTPEQLALMLAEMNLLELEMPKASKGAKSGYGEGQIFLILLYYFTHYTSLRVMKEKFHMSTSSLQCVVAKMIASFYKGLFAWSWGGDITEVTHYVHACYYLCVSTPNDSKTAADLYDRVKKRHGFHIHCIHDLATQKVVAYYLSASVQADPLWLAQYEPMLDDDDGLALNYERRMQGKFAISGTRFRGVLKEFHSVVGCLLALVNLDLGYGNPILSQESIIIDQ
jgi:hypothetical protein